MLLKCDSIVAVIEGAEMQPLFLRGDTVRYTRCKPPWVVKFYSSKAWLEMRQYVLQRDHYLCQCYKLWDGKPCGRLATVVHHRQELVEHPELGLDADNLISLSWQCHEKTKNKTKKEHPSGVRIIKA